MDTVLTRTLQHAETTPERLCTLAHSLRHGDSRRTFAEVATAAGRAAGFLRARGVERGQVVVLIGTHDADLYAAWLGAMWIGAVPTILAEPSVRVDRGVYAERLRALFDRVRAEVVLASPRAGVGELDLGRAARFGYDQVAAGDGPVPAPVVAHAGDLALLQHSSGTTGLHKGVMLSHGAIAAHAAAYHAVLEPRADDVVASWLPLYHDMGLIACLVCPLVAGTPVVWLSPFEWVTAPASLLRAASTHRATHMWLPNFAFQVLATRVREPAGSFDLSAVRAVVNCSEPVTAAAMDAFAARFAGDGLRADAVHACYAMAENVFAVTTTRAGDPPRTRRADRRAWQERHVALEAPADADAVVSFTSSGRHVPGAEVRIADAESATLPALHAGRVLVRSPFLLTGYHGAAADAPPLLDEGGFFDTGDLGFLDADGHLYVTGRGKDIVIVGGKNIYPQDVEAIAGELDGVHAGRVVCFGVDVVGLGTEGLVVLFESDLDEAAWPELARRVRTAVPARLDLDVVDARVVPRGQLRKSTSGKLARAGNREWYLDGRFGAPPAHVQRTL